jgi:hypothetical protein
MLKNQKGIQKEAPKENRVEAERNTLRLLCSVLIKAGTRIEICRMLDPSVFSDFLHRVVFEEIIDAGAIESRRLRQILPAKVTNRGFPDFDLAELLAPSEVSEKEIERLFESALRLLDWSYPSGDQFLGS